MRALSATEAFTPALERTKALLRPFSLKLWLKLGLVALAAQMGAQFAFPPVGNSGSIGSSGTGASVGTISPILIATLVVVGIVMVLLGLILFYVGSRLQFVLMEMVATGSQRVAPSWRRFGNRTWRWIALKIVTFLAMVAVVGAIVAVPLITLFHNLPVQTQQTPPGPAFWVSFLLIFVTIFVAVFAIILVTWVLRDFVFPFIVFEDAPIGIAINNAVALVRREPGSILFYLLMKIVYAIAGGIAAQLCVFFALVIAAIPLGLVAGGFWLALHNAGTIGTLIMYISFGILVVVFLAVLIVVGICVTGAVAIFNQAYTIYFLGGRIASIGNLLEPPPPPMPLPPLEPASA